MSVEAFDPEDLTPRELEVLALVRAGLSNREMAAKLAISKEAVRYHLKDIHSKLHTSGDRERLRMRAHRMGLLALPVLGVLSALDGVPGLTI